MIRLWGGVESIEAGVDGATKRRSEELGDLGMGRESFS